MTNPNSRPELEKWLGNVGVPLKTVWFLKRGRWFDERHVDDHDTFLTTITMTFERLGLTYALWDTPDGWCLLSRRTGDCRTFPTKEAAEMVAIHNG